MGCFVHSLDPSSCCKNVIIVDIGARRKGVWLYTSTEHTETKAPESFTVFANPMPLSGTEIDVLLQQEYIARVIGGFDTTDRKHLRSLRIQCENTKINLMTQRQKSVRVGSYPDVLFRQEDLKNILRQLANILIQAVCWLRKLYLTNQNGDVADFKILVIGTSSFCHVFAKLC
ncbi:hypothetical protein RvY_11694 [Ramazzottius varieornatus]|uniref:Uncharacterized protein n=1 Tax=Ramazzottius varieornatus TaxID=947166 RepID=A0A1D1VJ08_RAMVA|nr:hypothetical protein RvY_11694 [Ramazzottius varieornatus]